MLTKLLEFAQEFTIYIKSFYAFQNVLVCISFSNFLVAFSIYRVYNFLIKGYKILIKMLNQCKYSYCIYMQ